MSAEGRPPTGPNYSLIPESEMLRKIELTNYEEDPDDTNYSVLKENYEILLRSKDQDGNALRVIKLPMPKIISEDGRRFPASYANFYIANTKVLVPTFRHLYDDEALRIIKQCFSAREVIGIDCVSVIYGYGTIHCATQQQPSIG